MARKLCHCMELKSRQSCSTMRASCKHSMPHNRSDGFANTVWKINKREIF